MATLNLSANGPSITASYQKIVNSPPPSGPSAASPTYAQWAVFAVQAPLVSAFQQAEGNKESVLKVQSTGEGELADLCDDFSDGRIQFAYVKVKDPNTGLPKNVLVAWCGEGVPERTKGYFTSHLNAVSKLLHGYHVQIVARSDRDLTPEGIIQKVADSSGSKYSGGGGGPAAASGPPPPVASKPIMPTKSFGTTTTFQPPGARSRQAPASSGPVDDDGWGADAPQVTRSQLEKVESAYKPTKVDLKQLQSQAEPSRYQPPRNDAGPNDDVVRGGYQPIGRVNIAAIRAQAQAQSGGTLPDERPKVVKGAYEPVGEVDIAEIRRKAQAAPPPASSQPSAPSESSEEPHAPKSLAERSAAFQQGSTSAAERLTSLPKPHISNRFGGGSSSFVGTKPPAPSGVGGGFNIKPPAPPVMGIASRTFADSDGKTPAQQWEERRRARGLSGATPTSPIAAQTSGGGGGGGWQSGYAGKKWDVQVPTRTGGSGSLGTQRTGEEQESSNIGAGSGGGVSAMRDRFKDAAPMSGGAGGPPPLDTASKPNAGGVVRGGVAIPGLPPPVPQKEEEENAPREERQELPPPPARPVPADEEEEEQEEDAPMPPSSPARIAMPVSRSAAEAEKAEPLPPPPSASEPEAVALHKEEEAPPLPASAAATAGAGKEAIAQYDYEKAEDNELELREGERITHIDMVDADWWMGRNSRGEEGLFPSNYVELVEGNGATAHMQQQQEEEQEEAPAPTAVGGGAGGGKTATAQYDYEAAEDNELSFPDGALLTDLEFPDEDWWFGHYNGQSGLFPANYVVLNE
ncbi:hypothetical protein M433DRAFT_65379 [Acidomyces richmondensis BFW]|nr:MAG: hypothetical protein FE78DRAFT_145701 [Acidomyces sp. 'richmondensis']KYG46329.1 hypothetical protein M433DRAFT_65379 [Acidomyces richmondensis BFW]